MPELTKWFIISSDTEGVNESYELLARRKLIELIRGLIQIKNIMKIILTTILTVFIFSNCILDPFYSAKDRNDSMQISRAETEEKIFATAAIKVAICGEVSQKGILARVFLTVGGDLCNKSYKAPFVTDNSKNLQSCKNQYSYVSKANLDSCLSEIILSPYESASDVNLVLSVGYHACSSILNTRGKINFY
ncbi:hypothetical protein APS47_12755 [Leptospira kirschneri serovar Mozdok]|nr:hypothetical protein LEP1GSC126_2945 [Leptospira kirschneri str. 200801774]KON79281.1 Uncharacterized protein NV38_0000099 [Leptospira kirschneri serovar Mozdok]KPZ77112.1 hypothetical protein APS47_12755 [Leptospira kirschneri serovar Mozdok]